MNPVFALTVVIAFTTSTATNLTRRTEKEPLPHRFAAVLCPCEADMLRDQLNAKCVNVTVTSVLTVSGSCPPAGTACNTASTATPCSFSFDVVLTPKGGVLPTCCENVKYFYNTRQYTTGIACAYGPPVDGPPVQISIPFEQHVTGFAVDCGKVPSFFIREVCDNERIIASAELKCCNCQ